MPAARKPTVEPGDEQDVARALLRNMIDTIKAEGPRTMRGQAPVQFTAPIIPPGVIGTKAARMALDSQCAASIDLANSALTAGLGSLVLDGQVWLGFSALSQMAQRAEYRSLSETYAKHMTRRFAKLVSLGGDKGQQKRIKELEQEVKKFQLRKVFRACTLHDGFFGRGQMYVRFDDKGRYDDKPLLRTDKTIKVGSLKGFKPVEPIWSYPAEYNSTDPLEDDYFVPESWWVMGKRVHKSRLFTMISRPVPDILKAAYAFCGISLSQLTMEYVNNWVRTRNSVGDLVHSFSLTILKTNMMTILQGKAGGETDLKMRSDLFNVLRDNRGLMLCDKDSEDVAQLNTTLATLDKLQAQSQEQQAAPSHIPLIFLLGITPSGLNATSEGEIRTFYDWINSGQEEIYTDPFQAGLEILQLNKWGEIDEDISYEWSPLWQMDDEAQSRIRKSNADANNVYMTGAVVSPEEVRQQIASDPTSGYAGLDLSTMPEPPDEPEDDPALQEPGEKEPVGGNKPSSAPASASQAKKDGKQAADATFNESDHPRAQNGQFGAGSGSSHSEHSAHHANKADEHEGHAEKASGASRESHLEAAGAHTLAAYKHRVAEKLGGEYKKAAHNSSAVAHAASEKTGISGGKQHSKIPFVQELMNTHGSKAKISAYLEGATKQNLQKAAELIKKHGDPDNDNDKSVAKLIDRELDERANAGRE